MQLRSIKKRFDIVKYDILVWESDKTNMIWDADPVKASKYLKDIGEIRFAIDGVQYLSSTSSLATIVKQKLKNFNQNFEKIYSTQTAWQIRDEQLREEMRISISVKLIQAYRSFVGMYGNRLESERQQRKYIKFYIEDLQNYLLDLFEGKFRSLQRRSH